MLNEKNGQQVLLKIKSDTYNEMYLKSKNNSGVLFFSGRALSDISLIPQLCQGIIFVKSDEEEFKLINFRDLDGVNIIEGKNIIYVGIQFSIYDNIKYNKDIIEAIMKEILAEKNFKKQCEMLETVLSDNFEVNAVSPAFKGVVDKMCESNGRIKISELADIADYSVRHFHRIFVKNMGISPKLYLRILRCSIVIERMTENPYCEITDYMESLGFFDQAHFQREFKWYTGITPGNFLKMKKNPACM